jgi:hypothetical protein
MARRKKTKPVVEKVMHEVTPERYIDTGKVKIGQYYQRPAPQPDEDELLMQDALLNKDDNFMKSVRDIILGTLLAVFLFGYIYILFWGL